MKVLQILGNSAGGIAQHVSQVCAGLREIDGTAVEMRVAGPPSLPIEMPVPLDHVQIPDGPFGHRAAIRRLGEIGGAFAPDVVHAHGLRAGIDAGVAFGRRNVPVIVTVHNLVRPEIAGRFKAIAYAQAERLAVRAGDLTLCVSAEIANHLRARVPGRAGRIEVLYLGVDPPATPARPRAEVRHEWGVGEDARVVVSAARLAPQKALDVMLKAIASLGAVHLVVLGEGPHEARLRAFSAELGIADRVHFLGFRTDAAAHIAAADVFALSSVWEGIPLAAQEAMHLGTPIVATRVGGMPELVEDGISGRLVAAGDVQALALALNDVLRSRGLRERLARGATERITQRFSREKMLRELALTYASISREQ